MVDQKNEQRTLLLVEPDNEVRPLLTQNLRGQGYRVIVTLNEEDAIERMDGKSDRIDMILLNQVDQMEEEVLQVGKRIRQSLRFNSDIFIVVIAEKYGVGLEGKDVNLGDNAHITYLEDGQQLYTLLKKLCEGG